MQATIQLPLQMMPVTSLAQESASYKQVRHAQQLPMPCAADVQASALNPCSPMEQHSSSAHADCCQLDATVPVTSPLAAVMPKGYSLQPCYTAANRLLDRQARVQRYWHCGAALSYSAHAFPYQLMHAHKDLLCLLRAGRRTHFLAASARK